MTSRDAARRWQIQQELLQSDPETGIDERVRKIVGDVPMSSHNRLTADGTRIHYKVFGSVDRPTVFFCNGLGGTYRTFADVFGRLVRRYRLIIADYRGLFESGRPADLATLTIPQHARDLFEVAEDVGVERFSVFGWSMGVQVALEAFSQQPGRINALVFASGVEGRILNSIYDADVISSLAPAFVRMMRDHGEGVSSLIARSCRSAPMMRLAERLRLVGRNADVTMEHAALLFSSDPQVYWSTVEHLHAHDASDVLPRIDVPTLILHGDSDVLTPVRKGRALRTKIRGSEIWVFQGCTHAVILEYPERVARHVREFLGRRVYPQGKATTSVISKSPQT